MYGAGDAYTPKRQCVGWCTWTHKRTVQRAELDRSEHIKLEEPIARKTTLLGSNFHNILNCDLHKQINSSARTSSGPDHPPAWTPLCIMHFAVHTNMSAHHTSDPGVHQCDVWCLQNTLCRVAVSMLEGGCGCTNTVMLDEESLSSKSMIAHSQRRIIHFYLIHVAWHCDWVCHDGKSCSGHICCSAFMSMVIEIIH